MKRSLRTQMLIQYTVIVLLCLIVIPTVASWLVDRQIRSFASEKLLEDQKEIVLFLREIYSASGSWNDARINDINYELLRRPMLRAELYDEHGVLIKVFKRQTRRGGMGPMGPDARHAEDIIRRHPPGPPHHDPVFRDEPITVGGKEVGSVRFAYPPFKESREWLFLRQFSRHLYYAVGMMLILSVLLSFFMADRISRPILKVAGRALHISEGKYKIADEMRSDITEIQVLIDSVNKLGLDLEAQEELRKRLMGDIAHELRNPVTIIKSHLEAFEDGVWAPTPERLNLTVGEIDRLSLLISEVENLTSINNASGGLVIETAMISDELRKIALAFDPMYRIKMVEFVREIEPGVAADVDIAKIRQAVENLLSNALKYSDGGGKVTLLLRRNGDCAEISVEDSGIGIPESDLPYIFERFYRTDKSRARASGGMGIGLAITKAIIEAHGGTINVKSREGTGSIFTVMLPLRQVPV